MKEEQITDSIMHGFSFNIGDLLKVGSSIEFISSPANPDKHYTDHLRVEFRFWDGQDNVYVVAAEDGIELLIMEKDAELQETATYENPVDSHQLDDETYNALTRLGILDYEKIIHICEERIRQLRNE